MILYYTIRSDFRYRLVRSQTYEISFDLLNYIHHYLPKMLYIYLLAHEAVYRVFYVHELTVSTPSRFSAQFDLYETIPSDEVLRMEKVVDGAGIM